MDNIIIKSLIDTWQMVPSILVIMFVSLYAAQILIDMGVLKRLEFIGKPFVHLARLPHEATFSFITSFGSVIAGNTMTAELYRKKHLDRRQTILSAILNTTPIYLKESLTYQIPIMIPLLGLKVGILYFLTFVTTGMLKVFFVVFYGRLGQKSSGYDTSVLAMYDVQCDTIPQKKYTQVFIQSLARQWRTFARVGGIFVTMTFLIFLLINGGFVSALADYVGPLTRLLHLPSSVIIPVGTYIFSPIAGAASIGAMLNDGILSELQGITACILGSFLMLPVFAVRFSLPRYSAIFGLSLGTNILLISTGIGLFTRAVLLSVLLWIA